MNISVDDARGLSNMDPVERAIRKAADTGSFTVQVVVPQSKLDAYKVTLNSNGFSVSVFQAGYPVNDEDGWLLAISWMG